MSRPKKVISNAVTRLQGAASLSPDGKERLRSVKIQTPENAHMSGQHGVQYVSMCGADAAGSALNCQSLKIRGDETEAASVGGGATVPDLSERADALPPPWPRKPRRPCATRNQ